MPSTVQQKKTQFKKITLVYIQFIFLLMMVILLVSVFSYFISVKTFKMFPMYFPSTLQDKSSIFMPELRAIPRKEAYILGVWRTNISTLTLFLDELLLGPRSIYLKNPIPTGLYVYQIIEGKAGSKKMLYIILARQKFLQEDKQNSNINTSKELIFEDDIKNITNWVQYNVNRYFNTYTVKVILKNV